MYSFKKIAMYGVESHKNKTLAALYPPSVLDFQFKSCMHAGNVLILELKPGMDTYND